MRRARPRALPRHTNGRDGGPAVRDPGWDEWCMRRARPRALPGHAGGYAVRCPAATSSGAYAQCRTVQSTGHPLRHGLFKGPSPHPVIGARARGVDRGVDTGPAVSGRPVCHHARPHPPVLRPRCARARERGAMGGILEAVGEPGIEGSGQNMAAGLLGHAIAAGRALWGEMGICPAKPGAQGPGGERG